MKRHFYVTIVESEPGTLTVKYPEDCADAVKEQLWPVFMVQLGFYRGLPLTDAVRVSMTNRVQATCDELIRQGVLYLTYSKGWALDLEMLGEFDIF